MGFMQVKLLLIDQFFLSLLLVNIPRPEVYPVLGRKVLFAAASPELYSLSCVQVQECQIHLCICGRLRF